MSSAVFIDINTDVLKEGLALMRADSSRFKTIYMSHWPTALELTNKTRPPWRCGSYAVTRVTMLDSVQIMNLAYLRYVLLEVKWKSARVPRIDSVILQQQVVGGRYASRGAKGFMTRSSLQTMYVPLRELCRKFDAYVVSTSAGIPVERVRPLVLPPEANKLFKTDNELIRTMTGAKEAERYLWNIGNNFTVPDDWVDTMLTLYGAPTHRQPLCCSGDVGMADTRALRIKKK